MASWHTEAEKRLIREFGGEPRKGYGVDGTIDGDPVEVRVAKEDDRFRLGEDVHDELMAEGGSYIFDVVGDGKPAKEVSASRVDGLLPEGDWYDDRGEYDHKFLRTDQIF